MIYLLLKLTFCFWNSQRKPQLYINHGPEWKSLLGIFLIVGFQSCVICQSKSCHLRPRLHDAGRIWKRHKKVPFWPPVYTMPVEFGNSAGRILFRLAKRQSLSFCRFQILPASCKRTLPAEFYSAFVTRLIFLILPIVFIVVVVWSILIDNWCQLLLSMELA